jgi:ATP/maltotriose-dependent transcriptional regulator MalT
VHKGEEPHRLVDATRQVLTGKRVWLLGGAPEGTVPGAGNNTGDGALTEKEAEVLALVLQGCSNAAIAARLCLSCSTIKTHMSHIFTKLGVSRREELFLTRSSILPDHPSSAEH